MLRTLTLFVALNCLVFQATATEWIQNGVLTPSDGSVYDLFGESLAISSDTLIVGASRAEAAYVYVRGASGWMQQARIPGPEGSVSFGSSVDIDGDTAVIGSDRAAWVYVRQGTAWVQEAELVFPEAPSLRGFGRNVAISENTVVVSAVTANGGTGAAYIYTRSGTNWTVQATLLAEDGEINDQFGISVALDGNTALVGANFDNHLAGSAYVFERTGTAWSQTAKLIPSPSTTTGSFGVTVGLSGNTAIVGSTGGLKSAYIYVRNGASWVQQAKLAPADPAAYGWFGFTVALDGDRAVVTAQKPLTDESLFHYIRRGSEWTLEAVTQEPAGTASSLFGAALAIQGQTILAGTWSDEIAGRVYVYQTACSASVNLTYTNNTLGIGYSIRTSEPVSWGGWLVTAGGVRPLWNTGLPEIPTAHTGSFSIPGFPASGTVGVLSNMATTAGSQCNDLEVINTGGGPALSVGQLKAIADKALGKQP